MSVRIIGGVAKGRPLRVPPVVTRPTSARAREALFNRLDTLLDLEGCRVLDLYAGSGALGLEAISRGADAAVFVDADRHATDIIRANAATVAGSRSSVDVVRRDVAAFLSSTAPTEPFDVAFADPPYEVGDDAVAMVVDRLADPAWTTTGAVLVIERPSRSPGPAWPPRVQVLAQKRYGEASLWYGRVR